MLNKYQGYEVKEDGVYAPNNRKLKVNAKGEIRVKNSKTGQYDFIQPEELNKGLRVKMVEFKIKLPWFE